MFAPKTGRWIGIGWAFTAILAGLGVLGLLGPWGLWVPLTAAVGAVSIFFSVFFRDPERTAGPGIVSAADGRVRAVNRVGERWHVSVFMNVTNVHVNRMPVQGRLIGRTEGGRGFHPAYAPEAETNVQRHYLFATPLGPVEVVQVTGILARRLIAWVEPGEELAKGARFGMIALGSRVDVSFASDRATPSVRVGDRVRAGSSSIATERP